MVRLNKFMAECGVESRRKCDELILQGKVLVNGKTETRLGVKIDETIDKVKINGKLISPTRFEYIVLNKPKGYISTVSDEKSRRTVLSLVRTKKRLFPIGRLDMDTTGLLLLTNDGDLSYKLTHPKFEIDKIYQVSLDSALKSADRKKLESGIYLTEGKATTCKVLFPNRHNKRLVRLTLHQGWKRQVRRMFSKLGYKVVDLQRIALASLTLNGIETGEWRKLTVNEVVKLKNLADSGNGNNK